MQKTKTKNNMIELNVLFWRRFLNVSQEKLGNIFHEFQVIHELLNTLLVQLQNSVYKNITKRIIVMQCM